MSKTIVDTARAPAAIGPYSQAVKVNNMVFLSGQIPLVPDSMEIVSDEFVEQAHQVFKNLRAVAQEAGSSLADSVKLTVYVTDLDNFASLNDIMQMYFSEPYPARAAVQVAALPKAALIEIDAVLCLD